MKNIHRISDFETEYILEMHTYIYLILALKTMSKRMAFDLNSTRVLTQKCFTGQTCQLFVGETPTNMNNEVENNTLVKLRKAERDV